MAVDRPINEVVDDDTHPVCHSLGRGHFSENWGQPLQNTFCGFLPAWELRHLSCFLYSFKKKFVFDCTAVGYEERPRLERGEFRHAHDPL